MIFSVLHKRPYRLSSPPSHLFNGYTGSFSAQSGRDVKLTTHPNHVLLLGETRWPISDTNQAVEVQPSLLGGKIRTDGPCQQHFTALTQSEHVALCAVPRFFLFSFFIFCWRAISSFYKYFSCKIPLDLKIELKFDIKNR